MPLLRTGHADRARELHLTGYRSPSMSEEVGRHPEFCALTGNEARGLELLAGNRNLFDEVDSPLDQLGFLTGVEVLLQRIELLGHGEQPATGYTCRTWTVAGLRAEVRGRAARYGTTAHTDRRRARRRPRLAARTHHPGKEVGRGCRRGPLSGTPGARLDAAISRLTVLGCTEETEPLTSLAGRLRDEEVRPG